MAVGLLLLTAATALAHASLVESDPVDGGVVEGTPATFRATFDEELDAGRSRIVVRNEAGDEVARGGVGGDLLVMTVALPPLPAGDYVARWTAVTPDDQGVTRGTIAFTVEIGPPSPPVAPTLPVTAPPAATSAATSPASPSAPSPAASPAASPAPATASAQPPAASPAPSPVEPGTETGTGDLLIALVIAGVLLGGLVLYLFRR
jgi:methionine-rich copper-binding protein CopC